MFYGVTIPRLEILHFLRNQVIINSRRFPQLQIQSSANAFQELSKAYNTLGSVTGGTVMNWFNFVGQPFARNGSAFPGTQDKVASGSKDGSSLGSSSSDVAMFQSGYKS